MEERRNTLNMVMSVTTFFGGIFCDWCAFGNISSGVLAFTTLTRRQAHSKVAILQGVEQSPSAQMVVLPFDTQIQPHALSTCNAPSSKLGGFRRGDTGSPNTTSIKANPNRNDILPPSTGNWHRP